MPRSLLCAAFLLLSMNLAGCAQLINDVGSDAHDGITGNLSENLRLRLEERSEGACGAHQCTILSVRVESTRADDYPLTKEGWRAGPQDAERFMAVAVEGPDEVAAYGTATYALSFLEQDGPYEFVGWLDAQGEYVMALHIA